MSADATPRWLVLVHHLPSEPNYLRVKVGRRLDDVGALALKGSVYLLPRRDDTLEDFQWILRDIREGGGEGHIFEVRLRAGLTDAAAEALFKQDRERRYQQLLEAMRAVSGRRRSPADASLETAVRRFRKQLDDIVAVDFFAADGRPAAEALLTNLEEQMKGTNAGPAAAPVLAPPTGATWVTRTGLKVDRMASVWLIRRFIDRRARFKFVDAKEYHPRRGELRFDMFEGEFTHEGDRCTFEVLRDRFRLGDFGLGPIAEIVHDIDLKDSKYGRPETAGIAAVISGIVAHRASDADRVADATALLDGLYAQFRATSAAPAPPRREAVRARTKKTPLSR